LAPEYHKDVPRDLVRNIDFRKKIIRAAGSDRELQSDLKALCRVDPLFWWNSFVFTYDPRLSASVVPMVTYGFQDEAISDINGSVGISDICISKSRDMGASWMLVGIFLYRWMFRDGESFLLVSRNEDYVDKAGNPKSLFWKIDFIMKHLPGWMLPSFSRTKLRLSNNDNGSTIDGESTTGDVARGDRRTAIGLDEFAAFDIDAGYRAMAATRDATNSRIFNSTPNGTNNAFHAVAQNEEIKQVRLHWTKHPKKSEGLYYEGDKARSPWYDREVKRCASPVEIAQELDISFGASQQVFFDINLLAQYQSKFIRAPYVRGEIDWEDSPDNPRFDPAPRGRLKLWTHPDANGDMPRDRSYAVGIDIATGTGSSNSCLSIGDRKTREKIGEFAVPNMRPDQLAKYAVALARWLRDQHGLPALLCWEAAGPGRIFGDVVVELGHREIWFRRKEGGAIKKQGEMMGWIPTRDTKLTLFGNYRRQLFSESFINRSKEALAECSEIVYMPGGGIEHTRSVSVRDSSGARMNHGDRATADALLCMAMGYEGHSKATPKPTILPGSLMYRRRRQQENKKKATQW
jgi:hypothetical protein